MRKQQELTGWFPASMKPARPGVYQTYDPHLDEEFYNVWNGKVWFFGHYTPNLAEAEARNDPQRMTSRDISRWRGLKAPPPQTHTDSASGRAQRTNNNEGGSDAGS